MKWAAAVWMALALVSATGLEAQTERARPAAPQREAKPDAAPGSPAPGIPALNYPTLDYAPQIPVADTSTLLGLPRPEGAVPFAPAQIAAPRTLALQVLTLPTNSLAQHQMQVLRLPVLSYAPRSATPADPAVTRIQSPYVTLPDAPAFYLPSPMMQYNSGLLPQQLTVNFLPAPLQSDAARQTTHEARPAPLPEPPPIANSILGLGLGVLGGGIPGMNVGAFGGGQGAWMGLGNMGQTVNGGAPAAPAATQEPYLPGMRY